MAERQYTVQRLDRPGASQQDRIGQLFDIPAQLEDAPIDFFMDTPENFRPLCGCRAGWKDDGVYIWEYAFETELRMEEKGTGCRAWEDSCLEVFMAPDPKNPMRYFNYECTPGPYVHLGLGEKRDGRFVFSQLPEGMEPVSRIIPETGWCISFRIPLTFLKSEFGIETLTEGMALKANFQKCGDLTRIPHFALWNGPGPEVQKPDFHRPEFFGTLILK